MHSNKIIPQTVSRIFGMTFLFPGISLYTVGNSFGVQPTLAFATIVGMVVISISWWRLPVSMISLLTFCIIIVLTPISTLLLAKNIIIGLKAYVIILSMLFIAIVLSFSSIENVLKGYLEMAIIISFYAIYQWISMLVWVQPFIFINNYAFYLATESNYFLTGRAFGFCPEPSILASLLIPASLYFWGRIFFGTFKPSNLPGFGLKEYFPPVVTTLGALSTGSAAILIVLLPFLIIIAIEVLIFQRRNFSKIILAIVILTTLVWLSHRGVFGNYLQNRFIFGAGNTIIFSILGRVKNIAMAPELFIKHPFGVGLSNSQFYFSGSHVGIDSLFLLLLVEIGFLFIPILIAITIWVLSSRRKLININKSKKFFVNKSHKPVFFMSLSMLIFFIFSIGYVGYYHIVLSLFLVKHYRAICTI